MAGREGRVGGRPSLRNRRSRRWELAQEANPGGFVGIHEPSIIRTAATRKGERRRETYMASSKGYSPAESEGINSPSSPNRL